jgi:hypothetical protein
MKPTSSFDRHGFDLEMAILRDHDCEHLSRGNDASYRMHGKLLDDAVDGGDQIMELGPPIRLDLVLGDAGGLLLHLRQFVIECAPELCRGPVSGLLEGGKRGLGFLRLAALNEEILLLAHQVLIFGQIVQFRPELLVEQGLAHIDPLLERWNGSLELGDARLNRRALGVLCDVCRSSSVSLARCSEVWLIRNCRCISIRAAVAPTSG